MTVFRVQETELLPTTTFLLRGYPGIFAGGDCVTGPATAIKAIGAGKVAAFNIDMHLGGRGRVPEGGNPGTRGHSRRFIAGRQS